MRMALDGLLPIDPRPHRTKAASERGTLDLRDALAGHVASIHRGESRERAQPASTAKLHIAITHTRVCSAKPRWRTLTGTIRAWTRVGDPIVSRRKPVLGVKPVFRPGT